MNIFFLVLFLRVCLAERCPNVYDDIVRPCPTLDNHCIRTFFAEHSNCVPSYGTVPDEYYVDEIITPIPHANLSISWEKSYVYGLGTGRVKELYVNKRSNKVILEVNWNATVVDYSPEVIMKIYFKGREPLELINSVRITYKMISQTVTAPIDAVNGIRWMEKDIYTYFMSSDLHFICDKDFTDPVVRDVFQELAENQMTSHKEASLVRGPIYFDLYFNNNICRPLY